MAKKIDKTTTPNSNISKEPAMEYGVKANQITEVPEYVREDVAIGMKQYLNGESSDMREFMKKCML
ncbi:hypothetical protein [uncultured Bacteroides sp.]|uniref:hypothetical protein n=1 Tax=uncultured Bacteroides sp. TaxID=162156 RepID=UPI002AA85D5A|nr:hypothetical protein [uncultured Bacteroides sp.]